MVKKAVKGLWVELTHVKGAGKRHKITGITSLAVNQLMFSIDMAETKTSVAQYFLDKYQIRLQFAHWPTIQAGSDSKPVYLPLEVLLSTECLYQTVVCIQHFPWSN